jgi:RimJ/RimL family protein N-acetyltransferase
MNEMVIRAATTPDLPRVAELAGELVRMHHAVDAARFLLPDRVEEGYAWWLERELGRAEAVVIVAIVADQIVGYAYGTREGRDWNALLDEHGAIHMVDELVRRGAPRIVLSTMIANEPAQRLFAACGFRPTMLEMTR